MSRPKEQGELGIEDIMVKNICLLNKWLFKFCDEDRSSMERASSEQIRPFENLSRMTLKPSESPF